MKARLITTLYGTGNGTRPDLGGEEVDLYDNTQSRSVNFALSVPDGASSGDEVLISLAGEPTVVRRIVNAAPDSTVDSQQVRNWRSQHFHDPSPEWGHARDLEIDIKLRAAGLDPNEVRSSVQVPSSGKAVLQDQEYHAAVRAARRLSRPKADQFPLLAQERDQVLDISLDGELPSADGVMSLVNGDDDSHNALMDFVRGDTTRPLL